MVLSQSFKASFIYVSKGSVESSDRPLIIDDLRDLPLLKPISGLEITRVRFVIRLRYDRGLLLQQLGPVEVMEKGEILKLDKPRTFGWVLKQ